MKRLLAFTLLAFSLTACDPDTESDSDLAFELAADEAEERFYNSGLDIEVQFNPAQLDTPESIAADWDGNLFASSALNGVLYKGDTEGNWAPLAVLPIGVPLQPCGDFVGILGAITVDQDGWLYANVASCNAADRGVWRVDTDTGAAELIAPLGFDVLPNGIALLGDDLFIADSLGSVLTVPKSGGMPELWSDDPLLDQADVFIEGIPVPGPNGIQFYGLDAYVANSSTGTIIRIPVNWDGSAGTAEVYYEFDDPTEGCDDFAFDVIGRLYCTTDPFQTVVRVNRDGTEDLIFDGNDGDFLDGPTAVTFGRGFFGRFKMYITNAAFPFFIPLSTGNGPSVVSSITVPGGYFFR